MPFPQALKNLLMLGRHLSSCSLPYLDANVWAAVAQAIEGMSPSHRDGSLRTTYIQPKVTLDVRWASNIQVGKLSHLLCNYLMKVWTSMVWMVRWLGGYSCQKVPGLNLPTGFYVWSWCFVLFGYSSSLLQSKDIHVSLTGHSKLAIALPWVPHLLPSGGFRFPTILNWISG